MTTPATMTAKRSAPSPRALDQGVAAVYLPLDELRPNPRNPRAHGAEVVRLARTILRTTWGAPIIAQASTRRIIGGHGRLEAARMIAEGVEVDGILRGGAEHFFDRSAPGPLMVPVRLVDVSDAEADAMTLADNARALQGNDDAAAVVAMATAAFERDADVMRDMGYGAAELDALVKSAGDGLGADLELQEVDVSDAVGARFWLSVEGPLPVQPDALDVLRRALDALPGVKVSFVS
jgi:ParB-like chromosome segregation protein Spo0J